MATAVVQEQQLLKTLRWYDGFVIALANPGFLLGSLGFSVGDLGGWGAAMLWGISAFVAVFINTIYSELATMFPEKSGGSRALRPRGVAEVHDARRPDRHVRLLDRLVGRPLRQRPLHRVDHPEHVVPGRAGRELPRGRRLLLGVRAHRSSACRRLIAIGLILGVWLFNIFGARVGVLFGYGAGVLLMVPLFVMMILPFLNGSFDSANLTNKLNDPGPRRGAGSSSHSSGSG